MDNIIFKNEGYINGVIFKNCFSTLSSIYLIKYFNLHYTGDMFYRIIGHFKNDNVAKLLKDQYNLKKFVIYRDPFDRFVSLYKDMHADYNNHLALREHGLLPTQSNDEFVKNYLKLKNFDKHIISQKQQYVDVDLVVPYENFNKFVKNELKFDEEIYENSTKNILLNAYNDLLKYKDLIYENYQDDLNILNEYEIYK